MPMLRQTRVPLPSGPVLIRTVLFPMLATVAFAFRRSAHGGIRIATEGAYPFCQISHTQFCHRYFLANFRDAIATTWVRRLARLLTHVWYAMLEPIAFRSALCIVVPSRGMAGELQKTYPRITAQKIRVIPNPVETKAFKRTSDFDRAKVHEQLGIPAGAFVLSFCALGGFTRKGLRVVFEALAKIGDPLIHLIVIGGGATEIREFTVIAKQSQVNDMVHFTGVQSDIRCYLWASQTFVFPSAYETFSLACFQAAAAALPLITTRLNGVEDLLRDGENGWLVERTVDSVSDAIRDAARSAERTEVMGRKAQQDVQAYGTQPFLRRWLELLQNDFGICRDLCLP